MTRLKRILLLVGLLVFGIMSLSAGAETAKTPRPIEWRDTLTWRAISSPAVSAVLSINSLGQISAPDFVTTPVNKKIREFPDVFDLSTPLNSCVSFNYLMINGKVSRYDSASTERFKSSESGPDVPDSKVSEKNANFS